MTFSLFRFPFFLLCSCVHITLLCFCIWCGCLLNTCIFINICLFYAHMAPTPLHTVSYWALYLGLWKHRKWRLICGHVWSLTLLMTVKPHLEFFSLMIRCHWKSLPPQCLKSKRMISLETFESYVQPPLGVVTK